MSQGFFSQNMAVLNQHNPLLAEELEKAEDVCEELKIETSAAGPPTLIVNGIYIHSRRDPELEARRLVERAVESYNAGMSPGGTPGDAPAIVLGFGLGYAVCALAAKFPQRPIIVVEKNAGMIKKALEVLDLGRLFSENRLVFVLGGSGDGITGALSLFAGLSGAAPFVIYNRALMDMNRDWYTAVEGRIGTWYSRADINRATRNRFGRRWVRNLSKNLTSMRDIPGISRLEGILSNGDIPVFLAAAGPGLDAAGSILGQIFERCIIVAVDTSLRFLLDRGIDPDFVVSVDPQYWNFRHLDRMAAPKTCLIAESAVYPPVLRHNFAGIFLCASFFPLGRFIEDRLDPKGELGAGGSVATSAWDFIRFLGARQLWIAGLDLSFPELKTHFRGALFEEKSHAESCRFTPAETWNFRALRDGQPVMAKSRSGGKVLTDKRLSLYASWFENRFAQFPALKNLGLGGEGLELKGLETARMEDLLALPGRREEIGELLEGVYSATRAIFYSEEAAKKRVCIYQDSLNMLIKGLRDIKNLADDAAENAGIAASRNSQGRLEKPRQDKTLSILDAANKTIASSAVKDIAGFLFPETADWEAEINAKIQDPLARYLEFSTRFYRALSDAAEFNLLKLCQ